jgi:hypothetical protein
MISFQFIEEALRMFLERAEVLISRRLQGLIPYNTDHRIKSNQRASLGRLIAQFRPYCEDQELILELNTIAERRNSAAHKSLLLTMEESQDMQGLKQKIDEASEVNAKAQDLLFRVTEYVKRVDALLCVYNTVY